MLVRLFVVTLLSVCFAVSAHAQFDTSYWYAFAVDSSPPAPDHSLWDAFIDRNRGQDGRVDYAVVDPAELAVLDSYLQQLQQIDPRYYDYDRQLAYWINLHNAAVARLVISKQATDLADLGQNGSHRNERFLKVAEVSLSLNDIVEGILMPIWQSPDLYFLMSCAASHCPGLTEDALTAANVQQAVQQAGVEYLQRDDVIRFDESGSLELAATLEDYARALPSEGELMRRLAFMANDRLALRLLGYSGDIEFRANSRIVAP